MASTKITADDQAAAEMSRRIEEAANIATNKARKDYQKDGLPMASWRDGRVVWLDPVTLEEVPAPPFARTTPEKK